MFCVEVRNQSRLSTCVVRSLLYLETDFVDILFRVPECYLTLPFSQTYFFRVFQKPHQDIQGFKKWNRQNCFRKTGLNTTFSSHWKVSIVRTPTSVKKFFLARSNAKSHSFFIWEVMFNLTIFWVRENRIFLFWTQKSNLLILEDELFVESSTTSSLTDAFCVSGTALVPFAHSYIS